jgi:hypothetical protein
LALRERKWWEAGKGCIMRELHKFHTSPTVVRVIKMKEDEMGGACSTHGRYKKSIRCFGWKIRMEETTPNMWV